MPKEKRRKKSGAEFRADRMKRDMAAAAKSSRPLTSFWSRSSATPSGTSQVPATAAAVDPDADLVAVHPDADLTAVDPDADLVAVDPDADSAAVDPDADLAAVDPDADLAAVDPDADFVAVYPDADLAAVDPDADFVAVDPDADLAAVDPDADTAAVDPDADLAAVDPDADLAAVDPDADLAAVDPDADSAAVYPDADLAAANPGALSAHTEGEPKTSNSKSWISDIGEAVGQSKHLSNVNINELLQPWEAPPGFVWPHSERMGGGHDGKPRRHYLGEQHTRGKYECFAYSPAKEGLFCKYCVLFGKVEAGGIGLKQLVHEPLRNYHDLTSKSSGRLSAHLSNRYHEQNARAAAEYRQRSAAGADVASLQDKAVASERATNRAALLRILRCMDHLARLGIALRGHRDSGQLPLDADNIYGEGCFRATLQLMMECGDTELKRFLEKTGKNATYISPSSQNELLRCVDTVMKRSITKELESAQFFSLLADETTDVAGKEQLSVCLRYVMPDASLRERLLTFEEAPDLTGAGLATQLLGILRTHHIDVRNMVGQGYDGAAAMSGKDNGVQKHIHDMCPTATYSHCASHVLNLCLIKATSVKELLAAVTTMKAVTSFFRDSNKRMLKLQACINEHCPDSSRTRLKKHCQTRWVENQEATSVFKELMPAVVAALEELTESPDGTVAGTALALHNSVGTASFLLSLEILNLVLNVTRPLSQRLQSPNQDLLQALDSVDDAIDALESFRNTAKFDELFDKVEKEAGEIPTPRLAKRTGPGQTARDYFRVQVFLLFLDTCLGQLRERFKSHKTRGMLLCALLPSSSESSTFEDLRPAVEMYAPLLRCGSDEVEGEFMCWKRYWLRRDPQERPKTVLHALSAARDSGLFPAIATLLHIFATLPVTTASSERSFSALKRLKSYLRSTMSQSRLNGLAMLHVHKDVPLDKEAVLDLFGQGNRRLNFGFK